MTGAQFEACMEDRTIEAASSTAMFDQIPEEKEAE